jgi:putative flippase GtrA
MKVVMKILVMVVIPLGVAGVAYGIAYDGAGISAGWATALGWLAGLVAVFIINRFWCYRAAFRFNVKSRRAQAEELADVPAAAAREPAANDTSS